MSNKTRRANLPNVKNETSLRVYVKECMNHIQKVLNTFQDDLVRWQRVANAASNTTNIVVRAIEKIGIREGWWKDREGMNAFFTEAARELAVEAREDLKRHLEGQGRSNNSPVDTADKIVESAKMAALGIDPGQTTSEGGTEA